MASSNTDSPGTIYRWIERKPLTEAVSWTSKEKFWLTIAMCHYGTHDWKSVAQVLRHGGEPYRPREWFTPKSCERQFKILVSNLSKEAKSLPFLEMMQHIAEGLKSDYVREVNKSRDSLKSKYCNLFSILNRVKQGNLSRNEVVSLYSQARRNEIEGKQYLDQLMTRQNASLASENSSSGLIEEPIKWNTPSAPLLTSLLRSRNTIPANRTATTITSLLQSPGGTSRTRSGKLLPLTPSIRTTQGTPTLSKLLEAPANPYIQSPPQTTQKNKLSEVVTEKPVNTSRKENSQSTSLNRVRVDNMTTLGSFNQINKSDLSASKKQISKSPVSAVKNGSKANLNVVNLLSDSENEEDKNASLKSSFGDKKDTSYRVEPRATRSQTRAEGGFKQFNDTKLSDGKKERESLRQQSGGSQIIETHVLDDMADIDQIEVEPLSSVQDEIPTQIPSKMTRSSLQKLRLSSPGDNLSTNNKVINSKEISNKTLEEISANFVLKPIEPLSAGYQCLLGEPRGNNAKNSECLIPVDRTAVKDAILIRKDSQPQNTLTTSDGKLLKQKGVIELKAANIRCVDSRNDSKLLSFSNQPIVVVNKIKKPFNIKLTSEQRVEDIQVTNADVKKPMRLNNSSQNVVKVIDNNFTVTAAAAASTADDDDDDAVVIVEDKINTNDNNKTTMKTNNIESQNLSSIVVSSNISSNSRSSLHQLDGKKNKNDKTPWNVFGKSQNILDPTKKQCHQESVSKSRINSNISETNNRFIKELDFDFDQSISQTSLAELYNGVEEIVEMHSFDNEELNSLIECGSLDSNETEERRNIVSVDQGDSSVSESDSTIGAFDTFAQITRVRQKSSISKDVKLENRKLKTTNQEIKHLKESFCQSDKIEDDQSSVVSVTGIPVLQGVISDVMNQIGLDSVASPTTSNSHIQPSNDVVEILSSDDEMAVKNLKARSLNVQNKPIRAQDKEKEGKSYKFKESELVKVHEVEPNMFKGNNINCGINTIKPINIEMPPCIVVTNEISVAERMHFDKILAIKTEMHQDNEVVYDTISDEIIVLNDEEDMEPRGIAVKIANDKLLKETERMKREAEERKKKDEERKRKEDERLKKEDDERKKKENDIRMKRENEERKRKEEEFKKREFEKMLINERKKKEDEDRKIREEDERKRKEEYEKKIIALQATMKKEKEDEEILEEIDEEEKQKSITEEKLNEFHLRMRNEMNDLKNRMENRVVVKEEIIDECIDNILEENIIDEDILDDDFYINDEYLDDIVRRINLSKVNYKTRGMKHILKRTELVQFRDNESRLKEESLKSRIKIKEYKQAQDLLKKKEKMKLLVRDVPVQKGYIRTPAPTLINKLDLQIQEADLQKIMDAERQRAYEIISKEAKEAEMRRVKAADFERIKNEKIKRAEEVETKKSKEAELRKNIIVKETEIKGLEKRNILKKMNESENKRSFEISLVRNFGIVPSVNIKKKNELVQNNTNIEQALIETRKATAKEDFETFNLRERGIRKSMGSEGKKVIESKLPEIKMVTRTRGLKAEEKFKETNVSKNMPTKLRPQIKSSGSTPCIPSSTIDENLSISSYEYKKQTKNADDGNKRNSTSNIPYDNRHFKDLNVDSSAIVRKENLNHEAIGTPRTRTRSSSFKQKIISETKLSKQSQDNGAAIIPKETIGMKTVLTSTNPEHQTKKHIFNKHSFNDGGKTLIIPVVMLSSSDIPPNISQRSIMNYIKQPQNTSTHNQVQKPIEIIKPLEKPPPKKRGRKRRIDVQSEELQESNRNNKLTPKICRQTRTSIKEVEPLAKRTRRSLGLLNIKKESVNKKSVQPRKFKKELVDKSIENIKTNKKILKFVFNNLCERSKYILSLNEETKDLPQKCLDIVKFPIQLQEIKRKITAGKITSIAELQFNLLILSYNALMTKRSDSRVFSDASNFQSELEEYFRLLKNTVNDQNVRRCQDEEDLFYIHNNCFNKRRYLGLNYDPNDAYITANKKTIANIYKFIDNSCDESSGSESDSYMPPKKKRKKDVSDSSSSESD